MTELEARLSEWRGRLTSLQQDARAGQQARALLGLLALSHELVAYVYDRTAEQVKRSK